MQKHKVKQNQFLILFIAVIAALIIIVATVLVISFYKADESTIKSTDCQMIDQTVEDRLQFDNCIVQSTAINAYNKSDPNICFKINQTIRCQDELDKIIMSKLTKDTNLSLCTILSNRSLETQCTERIIAKKDGSIILRVMNDYTNASLCLQVIDPEYRKVCRSIVNNDLEICKSVKSESKRYNCAIILGEFSGSSCDILTGKYREDCLEYFKKM